MISPRGFQQSQPRTELRLAEKARGALWSFFLLAFLLAQARIWWPWLPGPDGKWLCGVLLILAAALAVAEQTRELPGQNVLLAFFTIGISIGLIQGLDRISGARLALWPIAPPRASAAAIWLIGALSWIVSFIVSRGTGRLVLRPWRKGTNYGFKLLGVTVGLMWFLELQLQALATQVETDWSGRPLPAPTGWQRAPWTHLIGFTLTSVFIFAVTMPALIRKKPVSTIEEDEAARRSSRSLTALWLLLSLLLVSAVASQAFRRGG